MIAVVNMGPHDDSDPLGECSYEVRLYDGKTEKVMAHFKHKRGDGLAKCLRLAGKAVEQAKDREAEKLLRILKENED